VRVTMAELREEPDEESEEDDFLRSLRMPGAYHGSSPAQEYPPVLASSSSDPAGGVKTKHAQAVQEILSLPPPDRALTPVSPPATTIAAEPESITPKRTKRPRTAFRFAHPPPPTRPLGKKGILRPKVLLQFQQRSDSRFHKPVYEVVPASRFTPLTRIGQKLQSLHKGRDGLAADDLVVVKTEDYKTSDVSPDDVEYSDARGVLGMISPIPTDCDSAWISLENSTWLATAGINGSYTLTLQDEQSQTARWYIPKAKRKRNSVVGVPSATLDAPEDRKYYFTSILPNTTKHPTIASMTASNIEVYDEYVSPTAPEETVITDDLLRKLIIVSGAWLFFHEGWSTNYKVNTVPRPSRSRTITAPMETIRRRSTMCCSPARSLTPATRAEEGSVSENKLEIDNTLTPPNPSVSPSNRSISGKSQSDARSMQGSITTTIGSVSKSEQLPKAPQFIAPQFRAATDLVERNQKRRSWGNHEFANLNWQTAKGSLSRRFSSTKKGGKPQDMVYCDTEDASPNSTGDSGSFSRHLRRSSQGVRRPTSARTNIESVDFKEITFHTPTNNLTLSGVVGLMEAGTVDTTETPVMGTTAAADSPPEKQIGLLESYSDPVASVESDDFQSSTVNDEYEKPKKKDSLVEPPLQLESSDALLSTISLANYSYWQQYDRLLERQSTFHTPSLQPTPARIVLSDPASNPEPSESKFPDVQHYEARPLDPPTPVYERKSSWKAKLKSKLHV
jgi:hypothetical protein